MKWKIIFIALVVAIAFLVKNVFLSYFSTEQQLTLSLLVFAVYLWTLSSLPTGIVSILLLASMLVLGVAGEVEEAMAGFLSPALYFILVLSLISHALTKVGIDKVVARLLINTSKGGVKVIVIGLPIFILVLPIFLPSAVARFKILSPLVERLNEYFGYDAKSLFKKYCMYIIGMLNQNASLIIFTGGGFSVLAYQLIVDFNVANISWLDWFLRIAPVLWGAMLIVVISIWFFLKVTTPREDWLTEKVGVLGFEHEKAAIPPLFWVVTSAFLLMILTWIFTDYEQVPLVLPPMLLVVFYALPKINLISNKTIRNHDWENFLLLGSSFSLAMLLKENGTANVLATQLIRLLPSEANLTLKILIIGLFVFFLRFLFTLPSSAMIVIFPVVISYADLIGVSSLGLAFLVVMITGGMVVLPIHSPTTYYAYESGVFTKREQYMIGLFSSIVTMLAAVIAARYFW